MRIADLIRERGPVTVAAFMELALYDPAVGYYARAGQRSGRAGDFFTSVDVGPIFGELLEVQIEQMFGLLRPPGASGQPPFDLVEAGAGNGRLSADILRAAARVHPDCYQAVHLHLVEAGAAAREQQRATLGDVADRLAFSGAALPDSFEGVLLANELLDAMPTHQVVMREDGLREVYVQVSTPEARGSTLQKPFSTTEGEPSTPRLQGYLDALGAKLEPGWRAEINLNAVDWIRDAARRLRRGFMILIDYGHEARELYSTSHSAGTLTTYRGHTSGVHWLDRPGEQDITAHVDFTSVRAAAEAEGMQTIAFLDQTYFLLGLLPSIRNPQPATRNLKTLIMPGGLGSTMKVLVLGKSVGMPALRGCSFKVRAT